jgi:TonB family protein
MHALVAYTLAQFLCRWLLAFILLAMALTTQAQMQLLKWKPEKEIEPHLEELAEWPKPIPTERPASVPPPIPSLFMEFAPVYKDGGSKGMMRAIYKNLHWPDTSNSRPIEGRLFVGFDVGSDGKVYDARIVKSLSPAYDAEALKSVKMLGEFKPASGGNGRPITTSYALPVDFWLGRKVK